MATKKKKTLKQALAALEREPHGTLRSERVAARVTPAEHDVLMALASADRRTKGRALVWAAIATAGRRAKS